MAVVDNLDSYSTGDLNGQGSWSGSTSWDIQTAVSQTAPNGAASSTNGTTIEKSFTAQGDGNQIFYVRSSALNVGNTNHAFSLFEGSTRIARVLMNEGGGSPGDFLLSVPGETLIATWVINTWYKVEIEWKTSDNTVRARVDDGTWTSFVTAENTFTNADKVSFMNGDGVGSTFYFDSLSDPNAGGGGVVRDGRLLSIMGVG